MRKFKILKPVYLDFLTHNDQYTAAVEKGHVELDGPVYYVVEDKRHETINYTWLIEKYLEDGYLEEIK